MTEEIDKAYTIVEPIDYESTEISEIIKDLQACYYYLNSAGGCKDVYASNCIKRTIGKLKTKEELWK